MKENTVELLQDAIEDTAQSFDVGVHYTVTLPFEKVCELVGREDDGSDGWNAEACLVSGSWVKSNMALALDLTSACEVEVDGEFVD
jgi:hypothetical protein